MVPPTWKLMLLSVGGRLFLVAAWWAGTHGDISLFFLLLSFSLGRCARIDLNGSSVSKMVFIVGWYVKDIDVSEHNK